MESIARLHRHVRRTSLPYLPDLHTPEEDLAFFRNRVFPAAEVWLAESEAELAGFAAVREGWLDHLYVSPSRHGRGIGSALLARAKESRRQLDLWTFQANGQARRFYERRGFRLVELTDGSANEERVPDARYRWVDD
ncbi:GNAT family N-acetyltransferase [Microvirga sp. GCM10011540]|uniref:GNAT family N-acetyltransferase n=1 Tax=Microvirga sp. GCM10011540 TaxID=3317338 RepID=UPI00360A8450